MTFSILCHAFYPPPYNCFSVKVVHRIEGATPSLGSDLLLYDASEGKLLAMLDADWITAMRTGAVAVLSAQLFRKTIASTYGLLGLGNTSRATLLCLLDSEPNIEHNVQLLRYKDQAELFIKRFGNHSNVRFSVANSAKEVIETSDVIFSCVTEAKDLFCNDNSAYKEGCLVIPVHTKGFQNCDLFFDKVFGDDTAHLHNFRYFNRFKQFAEISDVLNGTKPGRESDKERILSYNIGLGLHDAVFAWKIFQQLQDSAEEITIERETAKFWI